MTWADENQAYLDACFARLRQAMDSLLGSPHSYRPELLFERPDPDIEMSAPPAIDHLVRRFGLSDFERWLLLLTAGTELDTRLSEQAAGGFGNTQPGVALGMAMRLLPDAHWSALTPAAALRHWRLIDIDASRSLTRTPARIDERVLHYICGIQYLDRHLWQWFSPISVVDPPSTSQVEQAETAASSWGRALSLAPDTVLQLVGGSASDRRVLAAAIGRMFDVPMYEGHLEHLPSEVDASHEAALLWRRESLLSGAGLLLEGGRSLDAAAVRRRTHHFREAEGIWILGGDRYVDLAGRPVLRIEVRPPTASERLSTWQGALEADLGGHPELPQLARDFQLPLPRIRAIAGTLESSPVDPVERLREQAKTLLRTELDGLAIRVQTDAVWDDLVLPEPSVTLLQSLCDQARNRHQIEAWGFSGHGLGTIALLSGPSGTGKTHAARVIASELDLDLWVVDLSLLISKYIGETEENLAKVFDAAERMSAVLLFDEADAVFGTRTAIRDSHDRHANTEVSYLLNRLERYDGVALLTTNMKENIDKAFMRRFAAIVEFPFPDYAARVRIWDAVLPEALPRGDVDVERLGRLTATGGQIRSIALAAAHLAAIDGGVLRMTNLLDAARSQFAKMGRPLTRGETDGWV